MLCAMTLRRFFPIGSRDGPIRPGLGSVLSRLRPCGIGLSPRCRHLSLVSGTAKLRGAGVEVPFPLVKLRLPGGDGSVTGLSHPVQLISDLIVPLSNEIALVRGPRALLLA
jgi:hypothetical protein